MKWNRRLHFDGHVHFIDVRVCWNQSSLLNNHFILSIISTHLIGIFIYLKKLCYTDQAKEYSQVFRKEPNRHLHNTLSQTAREYLFTHLFIIFFLKFFFFFYILFDFLFVLLFLEILNRFIGWSVVFCRVALAPAIYISGRSAKLLLLLFFVNLCFSFLFVC